MLSISKCGERFVISDSENSKLILTRLDLKELLRNIHRLEPLEYYKAGIEAISNYRSDKEKLTPQSVVDSRS